MEKMNKAWVVIAAGVMLSVTAHAGWSQDSGRVVQLYANANGAIAVQLDGGFPNSIAAGQCTSSDGGWAGLATPNPSVRAALVLAKATGSPVVITTEGCEGGWLKILDVYVK